MIDIDGILYDADEYYYWEHLQACLHEKEMENA
jgi:hypothetical protein